MSAIHLNSVSFSYTTAVDVLTDVTLSLGPGWHGLVGENGAGKTTLLRLIRGELAPSSGQVTLDPADAVVAWCPQIVDRLEPAVGALAVSSESSDAALRSRLGLDPDDLDRWETLSPGERRRWQLATAVATQPDILCVDEPTNHLDAHASADLVAELARFQGVGLIVSHDRNLLDHLTSTTIRVRRSEVQQWQGTYSVAVEEWRRQHAESLDLLEQLRSERDRTQRRLNERRRTLEEKSQRDRSRRRSAGKADPDARSLVVKNRQSNAAAAQARVAGVDARHLADLDGRIGDIRVDRTRSAPIEIDGEASRRPVLLSHDGPLVAGGGQLHPGLTVHVGRSTRLRVTGPNGAGKTTLLNSLITEAPIPPDRIMWLPQELSTAERSELLTRVSRLPRGELGWVMAMAARLGLDPGRVLNSELPSPGEARKLLLADGLGRRVWVAVLDEPTNHLDLPSVERLEQALAGYQGALVLVTHDDHFAGSVTSEEIRLG